jgi:hypothetical protein
MTQVVGFKKDRDREQRKLDPVRQELVRAQRARFACAIPSFEKFDGDALGSRSQKSASEDSSLG